MTSMRASVVLLKIVCTIVALPFVLLFAILMIPFEIICLLFDFVISMVNSIWGRMEGVDD